MATAGRHDIGPGSGRLTLHTTRHGLAADVGHDLTIEVTDWSGSVTPPGEDAAGAVEVTVHTGSLRVVSGSGGLKPLTDKDKRDIHGQIRKILQVDRVPTAEFTASVPPGGGGGGTLAGTLTVLGVGRPLALAVSDLGAGRYRATGEVLQSAHGITPYTAFFGALRLADRVTVEVELAGGAE